MVGMREMFFILLVSIGMQFCLLAEAFRHVHPNSLVFYPAVSSSALYYDYFKKGPEKKEIGRIWKNIIFPGIYVEYADTKAPMKTVKIEDKPKPGDPKLKSIRNADIDSFFSDKPKSGTYNVMDPKSVPQVISTQMIKSKTLKPPVKPPGFVAPTPKKAISIKLGSGLTVLPNIQQFPRPKKPLILYDFENAANCKKVREACTVLDLTVEIRPCPGGLSGWSDFMWTITQGRRTLPFMVDDNPSMYKPQLFGAKEVIEYLFTTYGPGVTNIPKTLQVKGNGSDEPGGSGKGRKLRANARNDFTKLKPITLFGWEGAPYVKVVRETLSELGLAHILVNCANGSMNRDVLMKRTKGVFQAPYIIDPNTGVEMFESAEIVKYLEQVYTA